MFISNIYIYNLCTFLKEIYDSFFHLNNLLIRYESSNLSLCNVYMKYCLNKINTKLFTQQVGWFGGKRVQFHPWGPRIKIHK